VLPSGKSRIETWLRAFEGKLRIDREGRTVWVWLLPPGLGVIAALMVLFIPGVSTDMGLVGTVALAIFGLLAVTLIATIYLISFDKDHNQEAPAADLPALSHDQATGSDPAAGTPTTSR